MKNYKTVPNTADWSEDEGGQMELKIEYLKTEELVPYAGNAKLHPAEQIEQIKKSIEQFGMNDPIAIWKDNEIIEGHGRLIACRELGIEEVPVIRLDGLTDKQRKAYALAHNKLTMNSGFEFALLRDELKQLDEFDMTDFGFGEFEIGSLDDEFDPEPFDRQIEEEYPETGLVSYNVIISCLSEEEQEWLKGLLKETGTLRKLYDCSVIMERYEENT